MASTASAPRLIAEQQQRQQPAQPSLAAAAAADAGPIYVDTQHEDLVHDAQLDYYGSRLATCSSGAWRATFAARACVLRCTCL